MKILNGKEMKDVDRIAIEEYGIDGLILMENAADAVSKIAVKKLQKIKGDNVLIFCGNGNNGGDGFAIARILKSLGYSPKIVFLGLESDLKGDAATNFIRAKELSIPFFNIEDIDNLYPTKNLEELISTSNIVIDAIFGTGLNKPIINPYKTVIEKINSLSKFTISVDIPSGIDSNTGEILGAAVKADETITFSTAKTGLLIGEGIENIGKLTIAKIGVPYKIINEKIGNYHILTQEEAKELFPKRPIRSNKGDFGKILVMGGSKNMVGATYFTCKSCYKIGAGIVFALTPEIIIPTLQSLLPEVITIPYNSELKLETKLDIKNIIEKANKSNAIIIGPGIGIKKEIKNIVLELIKSIETTTIIDADGLNNLVENKDLLKSMKKIPIITPHIGEMSRLTDISIDYILKNPLKVATEFSKEYNCITVLKDYRTIIASPDGNIYINITGNNTLSKAGSGDILSGIIGGLIAQNCESFHAAVLGVYIHGLIGEYAGDKHTNYSLLASELIDFIPVVLENLFN